MGDVNGNAPPGDGASQETTPERPEWCDPEHWDADKGAVKTEMLGKAYKEIRTHMSRTRPQIGADGGAGAPQIGATPDTGAASDLNEFLQGVGLDGRELAERFASRGELTRGQYDAFAKKGVPRPLVDRYLQAEMENSQVRIERARTQTEQFAGGGDRLQNLIDWAGQNLDREAIRNLNARLANPTTMLSAVKEIYADHQVALGAGKTQPLMEGGKAPGTGAGGYRSHAEVNSAMSDPRYTIDQAYTDEVNAKLSATSQAVLPIEH